VANETLFAIKSTGAGDILVYRGAPPKTIDEALDVAIQKWQFIVDHPGTYYEGSSDTCGLCMLYPNSCWQCPISFFTGKPDCSNTPYYEYRKTAAAVPFDAERSTALAKAFVDLLTGIRDQVKECCVG